MSTYVPVALKRLVRERFANCQTAEDLTATHFEIEHIDPRAAGGETQFANLCISLPMCNRFNPANLSGQARNRQFIINDETLQPIGGST